MFMITSLSNFVNCLVVIVQRLFTVQPTRPQLRAHWPTQFRVPASVETTPTFRILYTDPNGNTWFQLASCRNSAEALAEDIGFCPCDCGSSCNVKHIERLPDNCWEAPLMHEPQDIEIMKTDPDAFEKHFTLLRWGNIRHYKPINQPDRIVYTRNH